MADHRHKRDANARSTTRRPRPRAALVAGPVALLATSAVVALGVATADPGTAPLQQAGTSDLAEAVQPTDVAALQAFAEGRGLSRDADRTAAYRVERGLTLSKPTAAERMMTPAAVRAAVAGADQPRWSTAPLNLWTGPTGEADQTGVLDEGKKVLVTGRALGDRVEIVVKGSARWVTAGYLSEDKPVAEEASDVASARSVGSATCTNGTSVPSGVSPNIAAIHEAVCAAFPTITTYGTFRSDGEHAQGIAIDIMVSGDLGYQVRDFVQANYQELGVNYIIYSQQIWSVDRASEGWRAMEDRGSVTANHYDHVHVTTY
ncbi:hypothetical protein [Nocardioides sp. Leaf285]|uniref:hypothetical protein n=1 Tax=Nocardioides sp. Leaf285 TaxID=1736322 RepID=UPI000703B78D|nr:hypothetical protein [Nocardioides sp. Leaf285]KQP64686.1 hypothetical protein ASF47_12245 [Nocardioides sp. Leaf285]